MIEERRGRVKVISSYHRLTAFLRIQPVAKRPKQRFGTRKTKQQQLLCEGWTGFFQTFHGPICRCFDCVWIIWFPRGVSHTRRYSWGVEEQTKDHLHQIYGAAYNPQTSRSVLISDYNSLCWHFSDGFSSALPFIGLVFPANSEAWQAGQADARAAYDPQSPLMARHM